ncbi:MAG: DUF1553 domain-containing protein [Planctomycetaceae bacterium]
MKPYRNLMSEVAMLMCVGQILFFAEGPPTSAAEPGLSFNRDIRPILADRCFHCHGPDGTQRKADLRLDDRTSAIENRNGTPAIAPGKPEASELLARITSSDPDLQMPPPGIGAPLTPQQIERLRQWIADGAEFEPFWSFIPPQRHPAPVLRQTDWIRQPLDRWVLSRLEAEGLAPSAEASRETLIRRVTLDLTGVPPTETELDQFLADESPDAYERLVDRLLASPEFGERMSQFWLDAARYADTNGYFTDNERTMWRWREGIIAAFNANQPFDQFTIEQLAGDLLPDATSEQLIASGFNRNHMTTNETGIIDEEYRISYVMDRMETTGTVWLGMTFNCARCHTHKFDPIAQREYYQLLAFFNQVPETGIIKNEGNADPLLTTPTDWQQTRLQKLKAEQELAAAQWMAIEPQVQTALTAWLAKADTELPAPPSERLLSRFSFEEDLPHASTLAVADPAASASIAQEPATDAKAVLVAAGQMGSVTYGPAIQGRGVRFDTYSHCETTDAKSFDFERTDAFSFGCWVHPVSPSAGCVLSKVDDEQFIRGFDLIIEKGKAAIHLNHRAESDAIQVKSVRPIAVNQWQHIAVTYDGSSRAAGLRIYLNGEPSTTLIQVDRLENTIRNDQPFRIGRRSDSLAFNGMVDEVCLFDRELSADEIARWAAGEELRSILARKPEERSDHQKNRLLEHFLRSSSEEWRNVYHRFTTTTADFQDLEKRLPTSMVMKDQPEFRQTFILTRGQYDQPTDLVEPGVPAVLAPLAKSPDANAKPADRLALARWLVSPEQTLTPRVIVNRYWQQLFGTGIVKTVNDFGVQGEWPTHRELLDELSVDFITSGWDTKQLLRTVVTSATYRQASHTTPELQQRDPENRLLARGPRFRLDAEAVRDQALAVSSLLNQRLGGPSVKPYQPDGLWEAVSYNGDQTYDQDHGDDLYRRSMYTFWKRQSPPPAILAWDGPTRETCVVLRSRTNTPLQALVLSNDVTYVEAARVWAGRLMSSAPDASPQAWIDRAFRQLTCRQPDPSESELLRSLYQDQLNEFKNHPDEADQLLSVGEYDSTIDFDKQPVDRPAWAALTTVMQVLLNLDETVTKE